MQALAHNKHGKESVPYMVRIDESGASTHTVACICLVSIAQRLMEHILNFSHSLGWWPLQRSADAWMIAALGFLMVVLSFLFLGRRVE
jgi:hypothetical protein